MHGDFKLPPPRGPKEKPQQEPQPVSLPPVIDQQPLPHSPVQPSDTPLKPRKFTFKKLAIGVIVGVMVAVAVVAGWGAYQLSPKDDEGQQKRIVVTTGSAATEIAATLEEQGIIRNAFMFRLYMRLNGLNERIQAGTYVFSPDQSVPDIASHLTEGKVDALRVTILPGQTLREIRQSLIGYGFRAEAVDQAFAQQYDHPILRDKPAPASLEGYIFPDTYEIAGDGRVEELIRLSFDTFQSRLAESGAEPAIRAKGLNLYQAITLASIIQEEVPTLEEQQQVAQVFLKRLSEDMPLGADPTFKYAAGLLGVEPRVSLDSPYNTRINKGLPPGPIANFNLSALEAVANPAPGDYLYFVAGDDGVTHFARTFEEHERNIARYCTRECAR